MGCGPNDGQNRVVYKRVTWEDINFERKIGERFYEDHVPNLSSLRDKVSTLRSEVHKFAGDILLTSLQLYHPS